PFDNEKDTFISNNSEANKPIAQSDKVARERNPAFSRPIIAVSSIHNNIILYHLLPSRLTEEMQQCPLIRINPSETFHSGIRLITSKSSILRHFHHLVSHLS